ncbi:hypothetical protein N7530_012801 [Penicillium desertorum]|uniref:Uncharacterized protein n=1 Tax=Penicillium desertorum TaxID=1303715 RepID=A0A9X0BFM6_9EURO|nr:hypothetical protein N7530_012801 [Penicillium desertorum]
MAQISRRRTQQITPERLSLLGHPPNVQSTSTKRKRRVLGHSRRLTERATTGEIHISPSRQKSRITLRLRQQQCQGPEPAWWTASEVFAQNDDDKIDKNQNDARMRPPPKKWFGKLGSNGYVPERVINLRRSSPNETRKSKRVCKV